MNFNKDENHYSLLIIIYGLFDVYIIYQKSNLINCFLNNIKD